MGKIADKMTEMIASRIEMEKQSVEEQAKITTEALMAQVEAGEFQHLSQSALVTCTMTCVRYQKKELAELYEHTIKETLRNKGINLADFLWQDSFGKAVILIVILKF